MKRSDFLKTLIVSPFLIAAMKLKDFENVSRGYSSSPKMPVLFLGHGHPMNALLDNHFTQTLGEIPKHIPKPQAIMVISAHWETRGSFVSVNAQPKTIYDFGRFDERLFEIKYEPQGHPQLAREVIKTLPLVQEESSMGLDHGAWTILKFLYPQADIPVFQMSIDYTLKPAQHFEMAQALQKIREKGVLIIGSGNIVHNLRRLDWSNLQAKTHDWAIEFDQIVKNKINQGNFKDLIHYEQLGSSALLSIPTEDHYLPMLYALGLAQKGESVRFLYEGFQYAGISMRCFQIS